MSLRIGKRRSWVVSRQSFVMVLIVNGRMVQGRKTKRGTIVKMNNDDIHDEEIERQAEEEYLFSMYENGLEGC